MKKTRYLSIAMVFMSAKAWAVERFPPPDFSPEYQMPTMVTPPAKAEWLGYLDIGLLFMALCLATYFAIFKRSRRALFVLSICSLLYFGFYRHGCICPVGAIQNTSLALFGSGYALPLVVAAFFLLPLIFALFAGRVFCSAVCPLGAVQELVLLKPTKVPDWLAYTLGAIPWVFLCLAVLLAAGGSGFIICKFDVFVPLFRFGGNVFIFSLAAVVLGISLFVGRPYCRFVCPYGALLRLLSPLSRWKTTISPDICIKCRLCEDACPYGEIRYPTQDNEDRGTIHGRNQLKILIALTIILIAAGYYCGKLAAPTLAMTNYDVRLAHDLWAEKQSPELTPSEASDASKQQNRPLADIYRNAAESERIFGNLTPIAFAVLGLVLGLRMISFNLKRRREDYEADSGGCVACGRCFNSCPVERARHGDPEALKMLEESSNEQ